MKMVEENLFIRRLITRNDLRKKWLFLVTINTSLEWEGERKNTIKLETTIFFARSWKLRKKLRKIEKNEITDLFDKSTTLQRAKTKLPDRSPPQIFREKPNKIRHVTSI